MQYAATWVPAVEGPEYWHQPLTGRFIRFIKDVSFRIWIASIGHAWSSKIKEVVNDATTQKTSDVNFNTSASSFSGFIVGFRILLPK